MVFSSAVFLFAFLPISLFLYFVVLKKNRFSQNVFLCIISVFFYAWGEPGAVFILLFSILFSWICGIMLSKSSGKVWKKVWLIAGIVCNISILFIFKYLNFFADNITALFHVQNTISKITLPIGISFFTFQAMSYIIDIYRNTVPCQKNPLYVGLYIAFFPQLIAGPIVRYETIAFQIENRKESFEMFSDGVFRFVFGLSKKVVLANTFAVIADASFSMASPTFSMAWLGAVSYSLQILYDFSGYSDMAIGLGKMFGFRFNENFNRPYIASSISDFWRRWHISMGTWFRDYVYFPLGGSRVSPARNIVNLFVVWLLTGLWHGANWTFIAWGFMYFILISIEKLTRIEKRGIPKVIGHAYTLLFVLIGWVLFRADSISYALSYLKSMIVISDVGLNVTMVYLKENWVIILIGMIACLPIDMWLVPLFERSKMKLVIKSAALPVLLILSMIYILAGTYNPFIYFNF